MVGFDIDAATLTLYHEALAAGAMIARLVPDGGGTKGAADRVRARVKSPNARSMMPREMVGLPSRRTAEKRSTRRSSS